MTEQNQYALRPLVSDLPPEQGQPMTVAKLREQLPQTYSSVSDGDLLMAVHRKYYQDTPIKDFLGAFDGVENVQVTIKNPNMQKYWEEQASKPMRGETPADTAKRLFGAPEVNTGGQVVAGLRSGLQGLTLGAGDEIVAGGASLLSGNSYDTELKRERDRLNAGRDQYPVTAGASEVAGALALPLGALAASKNLPMMARVGASAAEGGTLAGVYGFNAADDGSRLQAAKESAVFGAGVGAAAPLAGGALKALMDRRAASKGIKAAARNAPSADQLRAQANAAFDRVDKSGVVIKPDVMDNAASGIISGMKSSGLDQVGGGLSLTPQSSRLADLLGGATKTNPSGVPFGELRNLRRKAAIPAGNFTNRTESALGSQAINGIDDLIASLDPSKVKSGNPATIARDYAEANKAWATFRKNETIMNIIDKAQDYVSGTESGLQNGFSKLLRNDKAMRGFSDMEKKLIRKAASKTPTGAMIRQIGKLGFSLGGGSNALGGAAGLGFGGMAGSTFGPAGAAIGAAATSVLGTGARKLSERQAIKSAETLRAVIANGGMKEVPKSIAAPAIRALLEQKLRQGTAVLAQ